jgi:competence ComEA-like helix-hairpin-helix protein
MTKIKWYGPIIGCLLAVSASADTLVNVNKADVAALAALDGLNMSQATAIVRYREKYGPLRDAYDLLRVPGILMKNIDSLKGDVAFAARSRSAQPASDDSGVFEHTSVATTMK